MAEKIIIGVNDEVVEAKGEQLEYVLAWRAEAEAIREQWALEEKARLDARLSAIAKLEALGLTVDEVQAAFGLSADG